VGGDGLLVFSLPVSALTISAGSRGLEPQPLFCLGRNEGPRGVDRNGRLSCAWAERPPAGILRQGASHLRLSCCSSSSLRAKKSTKVSVVSEKAGAHHPGSTPHSTRTLAQIRACHRLQHQASCWIAGHISRDERTSGTHAVLPYLLARFTCVFHSTTARYFLRNIYHRTQPGSLGAWLLLRGITELAVLDFKPN